MAKKAEPAAVPQVSPGLWFEYDATKHGPQAKQGAGEISAPTTLEEPKSSADVAPQVAGFVPPLPEDL